MAGLSIKSKQLFNSKSAKLRFEETPLWVQQTCQIPPEFSGICLIVVGFGGRIKSAAVWRRSLAADFLVDRGRLWRSPPASDSQADCEQIIWGRLRCNIPANSCWLGHNYYKEIGKVRQTCARNGLRLLSPADSARITVRKFEKSDGLSNFLAEFFGGFVRTVNFPIESTRFRRKIPSKCIQISWK